LEPRPHSNPGNISSPRVPSTGVDRRMTDDQLAQMLARSLSSPQFYRDGVWGRDSDSGTRSRSRSRRAEKCTNELDSDGSCEIFFRSEDDITSTLHNCTTEELELFCSSFEELWSHRDIPESWRSLNAKEYAEKTYSDVLLQEAQIELELRKRAIYGSQDLVSRHTWALPTHTPDAFAMHGILGSTRSSTTGSSSKCAAAADPFVQAMHEFNDNTYIPLSGVVPLQDRDGKLIAPFGSRRYQCFVVGVFNALYLRYDCWQTSSCTSKVGRWFVLSELKRYWFPPPVRKVFRTILPRIKRIVYDHLQCSSILSEPRADNETEQATAPVISS